jgi:hypothetical protein
LFRHLITSKLTKFYHPAAIQSNGTPIALWSLCCNAAAGKNMKIYLLMALIGTLLTAIHFTSAPEQQSKTLPQ